MNILAKKSNKVIVHDLQKLCGFLNFLGRAIVPGRAFTRRLYAYAQNPKLKSHHHVRLTGEMKSDLAMWLKFLRQPMVMSRPFIDLNKELEADVLDMYSDASGNPEFGFGATCYESWMYAKLEHGFVNRFEPSIEYLGVIRFISWSTKMGIQNSGTKGIVLFCDNQAVIEMVNNTTAKCKNCMVLIRLLVLECLTQNIRVFARYVKSRDNFYSDSLSRMNLNHFWELAEQNGKRFKNVESTIPQDIWPISKIWVN